VNDAVCPLLSVTHRITSKVPAVGNVWEAVLPDVLSCCPTSNSHTYLVMGVSAVEMPASNCTGAPALAVFGVHMNAATGGLAFFAGVVATVMVTVLDSGATVPALGS
jgi:hypothetical protein